MHRKLATMTCALFASTTAFSAPPTTCRQLGTVGGAPVRVTSDGLVTFTANMDVNTDGSLESYKVDDLGFFNGPKLQTNTALNTICNGVRIRQYGPQGKDVPVYDHKRCGSLLGEFKRIRASDWSSPDGRYVEFYAIALRPGTAKPGRNHGVPCVKGSYYVSQTARPMNPSLSVCDPERWIDASRVPAIVVPITLLRGQGVSLFDVAMVRKVGGDRWFPAVVGDTNEVALGEATLRLAQQISGQTGRPANYRALLAIQPRGDYEYVIFPGSRTVLPSRGNAMEPAIAGAAAKLGARFALTTRPRLCP